MISRTLPDEGREAKEHRGREYLCGEVVGLDCGEVTNSTRFALGVIHDWAWVGMMYLRDLSYRALASSWYSNHIHHRSRIQTAGKLVLAAGGSGLEVSRPCVGKRIRPYDAIIQLQPIRELCLRVSRVVRVRLVRKQNVSFIP